MNPLAAIKERGMGMLTDWQAVTAITAALTLGGGITAFILRPINKRLDSHASQLKQIELWKLATAEAMSRTVTLLDQVEKRVSRIERVDDARA